MKTESMAPKSLYERMVEAGVKINHYHSDLQVESTETTRAIIAVFREEDICPLHMENFISEGVPWIEIAFMYDPHFNRVKTEE